MAGDSAAERFAYLRLSAGFHPELPCETQRYSSLRQVVCSLKSRNIAEALHEVIRIEGALTAPKFIAFSC